MNNPRYRNFPIGHAKKGRTFVKNHSICRATRLKRHAITSMLRAPEMDISTLLSAVFGTVLMNIRTRGSEPLSHFWHLTCCQLGSASQSAPSSNAFPTTYKLLGSPAFFGLCVGQNVTASRRLHPYKWAFEGRFLLTSNPRWTGFSFRYGSYVVADSHLP